MAKFCVYCGRPLQEGEECNCRAEKAQAGSEQQQETASLVTAPPVQTADAHVAVGAAQTYLKHLWLSVVSIYRAPCNAPKAFSASGDVNTAWGFLVLHALSFALFLTVLCARISASILGLFPIVSDNETVKGFFQFPLAKVFFLALVSSFALACLFAAILLLSQKVFFKVNTTYRHMLLVSGTEGLAAVPFLLAGMLLLFLNINFGICVALVGLILQPVFTFFALQGASPSNPDKSVYSVLISLVLLAVCMLIVTRITYSMYLPDQLKEAYEQIKSGTGNLQNLLGSLIGGSGSGSTPNLFG